MTRPGGWMDCKKWLLGSLGAVALSLPAWGQSKGAFNQWQSPTYLAEAFYKIALENEYQPGLAPLRRWQRPIHYQLQFAGMPKHPKVAQLVHTHFQHLAAITGMSIEANTRSNNHPANFQVILTKDASYQQMIERHTDAQSSDLHVNSHCMASIRVNKTGEITQAHVIIPVDHAMSRGLLPACVVEELTQAMGLPNDANDVHPSIANDASRLSLLTGLDLILLQLLYHPQLQAGMRLPVLKKKIPNILAAFEQQGRIQKAAQTVKAQGVYRLLY